MCLVWAGVADQGVASQSVWRESSTVDRRTGAYYKPCGLPLSTLGGGGASDEGMCAHVRPSRKKLPALVSVLSALNVCALA